MLPKFYPCLMTLKSDRNMKQACFRLNELAVIVAECRMESGGVNLTGKKEDTTGTGRGKRKQTSVGDSDK